LVEIPEVQCCGIPFFDVGDIDTVIEKAKHNVKVLKSYVSAGYDIVVPVPTCALRFSAVAFPSLMWEI
jgi:glycerol-3-phosphate dehydrogenase subunit C